MTFNSCKIFQERLEEIGDSYPFLYPSTASQVVVASYKHLWNMCAQSHFQSRNLFHRCWGGGNLSCFAIPIDANMYIACHIPGSSGYVKARMLHTWKIYDLSIISIHSMQQSREEDCQTFSPIARHLDQMSMFWQWLFVVLFLFHWNTLEYIAV